MLSNSLITVQSKMMSWKKKKRENEGFKHNYFDILDG